MDNAEKSFIPSCPDMLTLDEFKTVLSIKRSTAYALLKSKEIRSFRIGKKYRVLKCDVEEYIRNKLSEVS